MKKLISLFTMGAMMALLIPSAIAFDIDLYGITLVSEQETQLELYELEVNLLRTTGSDRVQYKLNDSEDWVDMDPAFDDTNYESDLTLKIGHNDVYVRHQTEYSINGTPFWYTLASSTFAINYGSYYINVASDAESDTSEYLFRGSLSADINGSELQYRLDEEDEWQKVDDLIEQVGDEVFYSETMDLELGENIIHLRHYWEFSVFVDDTETVNKITLTEIEYMVNYDQYGVSISSGESADAGEYMLEASLVKLYPDGEDKVMYSLNGGDYTEMTVVQDDDKAYFAELDLLSGENTIYVSHRHYTDEIQFLEFATDMITVEGYAGYDIELLSEENHVILGDYEFEVKFSKTSNKYQYSLNDGDWSDFSEVLILESDPEQIKAEATLSLNPGNNLVGVRQLDSDDMVLVEEYFVIFDDEITDGPLLEPCNELFNDVSATDEDCAAMSYVHGLGVFTGTEEGNLEADRAVNRAEAMKIMVEFLDVDMSGYDDTIGDLAFSDISEGAWYNRYLKYGVLDADPQVIQGYEDGTYKPGDTVSRAEFAKIFVEAIGLDVDGACELARSEEVRHVGDDIECGKWYSDYVQFTINGNLIDVDSDNNFNPSDGMNRRDIIRMIWSYSNP